MRVLFLFADGEKEWNSSHWRSYLPSTYLNRFCKVETEILPISSLREPHSIPALEKADVIYIERVMSIQIFSILEQWRARGKKVVFDMDDSYKNIPTTAASYNFWVNGEMEKKGYKPLKMEYPPIEQIDWFVKLMDAISSPSKLILEDWKDYNDSRLWIPNYVDADLYEQIPEREGLITIGWGGGASHYGSWYDSGLMTALRRVYTKYKSKVQILLITKDESLTRKMIDVKPKVVKADRLTYPGEMFNLDIALAPLAGQYDRRRSWLKIAEYAASAIPWIASNYDPYQDYCYPGSILVNNKPAEWENALSEMIENYPKYRQLAKESYARWMKDFSIQENHQFLKGQFESVLSTTTS